MISHDKDYLSWCLDKKLDPNSQAVFESYVFRTVTSHETMMEQIRRLNEDERVKHELRKQAALKRIQELRQQQKTKEQCDQPYSS
jgi:hypothetical protein